MTEVKEIMDYLEERAEGITRYSDKLSKMIIEIDKIMSRVAEKAGIPFTEDKPFFTGEDFNDPSEFLAIGRHYDGHWTIAIESSDGDCWDRLSEQFREIKKTAIKALPSFLQPYANFLKEKEVDYKEAAEMAEKIVNVLK